MSKESEGYSEIGFRQRQITRFLHKASLNYEAHGSENLDRVRLLESGKIVAAIWTIKAMPISVAVRRSGG